MKYIKTLIFTGIAAVGGMILVIGEIDDSPGLGGIGLIMIGISYFLNFKNSK
jgi:hypothetical protein